MEVYALTYWFMLVYAQKVHFTHKITCLCKFMLKLTVLCYLYTKSLVYAHKDQFMCTKVSLYLISSVYAHSGQYMPDKLSLCALR